MINFSIVTISYNQIEFLPDCVQSIITQLHENDEYIIQDPGSTDGSLEYIQSLASVTLSQQKDDGGADGLNIGFELATRDYFYFLNSDDVMLPGSLARVRSIIEKNPDIDVFCFTGFKTNQMLQPIRLMTSRNFSSKNWLSGKCSVFQQGVFFKRDAFRKIGGFNPKNKTCWDGELLMDLYNSGVRFGFFNDPIALFRIHNKSITGSGDLQNINRQIKDDLFHKEFGRRRNVLDKIAYTFYKYFKYRNRSIRLENKNIS